MIYYMGQIERKYQQSIYVLFILKQTEVQRQNKLKKILNQYTTTIKPQSQSFPVSTIAKPSLLTHKVYANSLDNDLAQESENEKYKEFDDPTIIELFDLLFTEIKKYT